MARDLSDSGPDAATKVDREAGAVRGPDQSGMRTSDSFLIQPA